MDFKELQIQAVQYLLCYHKLLK